MMSGFRGKKRAKINELSQEGAKSGNFELKIGDKYLK